MSAGKGKVILYYPQQCGDAAGPPYSRWTEEMPLSLLAIAGWPVRDGFEVVIIDGSRYEPDEAHRRVMEACEGALLFATTAVLGYQVIDAQRCSEKVRARHASLPMFIGGWFASVAPELVLEGGLYQAAVIGQGELTFRELVQAVEAGEDLENVAGLVLPRAGELLPTARRAVVGWDHLLDNPWELLDVELYRQPQLREADRGTVGKVFGPGRARFTITYFSSFGCPLQCSFCCSPEVSGAHWKAMPADRMLDDLASLQERWGFDGVQFFDANFGVSEKRTRAYAQGSIDRGLDLHFGLYMQTESILQYAESTLDLMVEAGMHSCLLGAEVGLQEMMSEVNKNTRVGGNRMAARALDKRGVAFRMTYIIGRPGESEASMMATLEEARDISARCRHARTEVWPYRPIPGSADYMRSIELGYEPPSSLEEWGGIGNYWEGEPWPGRIPHEVLRRRELLMHYSALASCCVRQRDGMWERRARRHLEHDTYAGGALEARAFHVYHKLKALSVVGSKA